MFAFSNLVGSDCIPEVLSPEDELRVARQARAGDLSADRLLIESNIRLVFLLIKKYFPTVHDKEELASIGFLGLIKACRAFDPEKGYRFATFASRSILNEIGMHFRREKKRSSDVSLTQPIAKNKNGDELYLEDVVSDPTDVTQGIEKAEEKELLRVAVRHMDSRDRKLVKLRYGANLTQMQVGKRLSISQPYVARLENRILKSLKTAMEDESMETAAKKRRIAPETMAVLELLAEGYSPRSVSESSGVKMHTVNQIKSRYPDVIAELQGKHIDGTPLRFAFGHGAESIAHIEQPEPVEEEPAREPEEPRRHSVAELFQEISELEAENAKLKEDCAKAESERDEARDTVEMQVASRKEIEKRLFKENKKITIDKGQLLSFLLDEIDTSATPSDYDFIRGISYAIGYVMRKSDETGVWCTVGSVTENADAEESVPAELE